MDIKKFIVCFLFFCTTSFALHEQPTLSFNNLKLPNLKIYDESNNEYQLKDFQGKVLLIYFWASWRLDCVDFLEKLSSMKKRFVYDDITNMEVLPISIDFKDPQELISLYGEKKINNLPLFVDPHRKLAAEFGVGDIPCLIIIDNNLVEVSREDIDFKMEKIEEEILEYCLSKPKNTAN
ncbi:TlpA family protein disulfide reductase [Candidatus Cyrtobacter comes]|uniref:TlpA family protein disulfide reductase n=1 Tax=Candidatus Cyrtobacter comes TaxID=675776 RepID=A0ABU5L898_9RICK|nr:TlpA disulfide reductase family protein [Candidatus Cyrtobacter comes]MDZ5762353.1 TlpA family protein disulfide reductase [Candidatus Cyrtobacter comes]